MKITGTKEAFTYMVTAKNIHLKLAVSKSTVSKYRKYLKTGVNLSEKKMIEMLERSGARMIRSVTVWEVKK